MKMAFSALFAGLAIFSCIMLAGTAAAVPASTPQEAYIAKYSKIAVEEMYRSGVPASITLAQGLLESGYGRSELAVKANNHFGIKCHDWKGPSMYFDDDRKGECFRKYEHAEASFMDHSDFLRYRDRYKFLFELETSDYKGWAYGLKKAGYATDPQYPQKLIRLIEEYDLSRFDAVSPDDVASEGAAGYAGEASDRSSGKEARKKTDRGTSRKAAKAARNAARNDARQIPESPAMLEAPVALDKGQSEKFSYMLSRRLYSQNNVPFVYSVEGETYASIAKSYDLFFAEIMKYNDADADRKLLPGTVVYLQAKKKKAARGVDKYVAEGGETLWSISQRFGVRMKSLQKLNGLDSGYVARPEDTIRLR